MECNGNYIYLIFGKNECYKKSSVWKLYLYFIQFEDQSDIFFTLFSSWGRCIEQVNKSCSVNWAKPVNYK